MMSRFFNQKLQEIQNDMKLEYHERFNSNKKELLDYAFSTHTIDRVAELGCVWGVEGAYGQYVSEKFNPSMVTMVDTNWDEETLRRCSKYPQIQTMRRNFGEPSLPSEIGQVDTIILFDVLLHQVAPDWTTILQMYAQITETFIIYNQQFIASPITVRLLDLGYDGYFENTPHEKKHITYQNLFNKMFDIHPEHNRIWRDLHNVWQWGITDQDLIHIMDRLGFQLDYYKNYGQFANLKNFEEHAFFFKKKKKNNVVIHSSTVTNEYIEPDYPEISNQNDQKLLQSQDVETQIKTKIEKMIINEQYNNALEAIRHYEQSIPNDPDVYSMKSVIFFHSDYFDDAELIAKIGLILNPTHKDLLNNLAFILKNANKLSQARYFYSIAIDFATNPNLGKELLYSLAELERCYQLDSSYTEQPNTFLDELLMEIHRNLGNQYKFNVPIEYLESMDIPYFDNIQLVDVISERSEIVKNIEGISWLYSMFKTTDSKQLLLNLLVYRILGNGKVLLPLNNTQYWISRKSVENLISSQEVIHSPFHNWALKKYDLDSIGFPLQLFFSSEGVYATFIQRQYEYNQANFHVKAQEGDIVIDCGGCWGDTALYFAAEVGKTGHVYTMEFIPSNLEILQTNLQVNPNLMEHITIVPNPLWSISDETIFFIDRGPASTVNMESFAESDGKAITLTIDDLVNRHEIERVDFIKMDIEGAEMPALHGAVETIKKHRPTLAIAVYHQLSDFHQVPKFINDLGVDYDFFLNHNTIFVHETVLFAVPRRD